MRPYLRIVPILMALAAVAALLLSATGTTQAAATKLKGSVTSSATISLKTSGGASVNSLKAGTYAITVKDSASSHNFHLLGPGVDKKTSVSKTGTVTWTVKLKKGTYTYQCDPHSSTMKKTFKVT